MPYLYPYTKKDLKKTCQGVVVMSIFLIAHTHNEYGYILNQETIDLVCEC